MEDHRNPLVTVEGIKEGGGGVRCMMGVRGMDRRREVRLVCVITWIKGRLTSPSPGSLPSVKDVW